jgi:hypothetical protein
VANPGEPGRATLGSDAILDFEMTGLHLCFDSKAGKR